MKSHFVVSPESPQSYQFAVKDLIASYSSEARLAFNHAVVLHCRLQPVVRQDLAVPLGLLRWQILCVEGGKSVGFA